MRKKLQPYLLALPWLISLGLFWLYPIIYSFIIGFTDKQLLKKSYTWVGWDNYTTLFSDPAFIDALKNTFIFVIGTIPVTTILALLFALLINNNFKGRGLFRAGYFLPSITSMVVVALIFTNLFQRGGYIALLAGMLGFTPPENGFLLDNGTALYAIMGMDVWMAIGYYMLIFLAGLKSIPEELYEAASLSGAGKIRQFFSITLPLLKPVGLFIIVINSIKSFQVFVEIFVMTQGEFKTATMVYCIYKTGLTAQFNFGYASAASYILFLIIAFFSLLQFYLLRQRRSV